MATNNIQGTVQAGKAFAPDKVAFKAEEVIPDSLLTRASTVVDTTFEGDNPSVLVPWINDAEATWTPEAQPLDVTNPNFSQVTINVRKITQLTFISNELWYGQNEMNPSILSTSSMRAVTKAANTAFITAEATTQFPLTGIAHTPGMVTGGNITTSLDPLADAVAQIEANGGTPNIILANPLAWGALRNLKTGKDANTSLLGAGTEDQGKKLFGVEVITSAAVPAGQMIVIDSNAIASVAGKVEVANSEHALFTSDSVALRVIWHMGWAVQHPDRIATVTVGPKA